MYEWLWDLLEDKVDVLVLADAAEVSRKRKLGKAKIAIAQKIICYLRKMMITGEVFRKGEPTDRQAKLNQIRLNKK